MTHQAILTKAVDTVMAAGFKPDGIENVTSWKATVRGSQAWIRWFNNEGQEVIQDVEHVIFNHDFAKALWLGHLQAAGTSKWIFNLQQMVIADDPIAYLGEHLDK